MRTQSRALSLESVEDRSLPSHSFVFVEPIYSYQAPDRFFAPASQGRGWQARTFQAESFIRVRFADDSVLFIRETPTGFQLIPVTLGTNFNPPTRTPPPDVGPVAGGETSSTGGSAQGGDTGSAGTPVVGSRGPVRTASAPTAVGEVAIAPVNQANTPAQPANADQAAAANAAAQVAAQSGPPGIAQATPTAGGHAAYAITAIVPEESGTNGVQPPDPTPMPGPTPTPAPNGVLENTFIQVAAAVAPVAGVVSLDLSALEAGAGQFLDRMADLAPSWPDSMPAFSDTLWVAAGALLTGGAAYAFTARSAPRPARDPLTGALSEWERRNGRATG
jgi:hypothetical protein